MPRVRIAIIVLVAAVAAALAGQSTASAQVAELSDSGCDKVSEKGTRQEFRCRYGPVTLGPYQVRQETKLSGIPKPAVDGSIVAMSTNVTERDGTAVPIQRLMLHHIVFGTLLRKDSVCDQFTMWDSKSKLPALTDRFYGAGEERSQLVLPPGYGYPIKAREEWSMVWMFMNHRAKTDTAYISYDVTVDTAPGLTAVKPYWLDVRNCWADPVYDVPGGRAKGSTTTKSWDYVMPESGRIVAGGGHVHGGAKSLTLTEPDCDDRAIGRSLPMWGKRSDPFYNVRPVLHEPGPISMSGFTSAKGVRVAKGERLRLNSTYDNQLPHTRVMGIYVVYVAPDQGGEPCAKLPSDQVYGWWRTDGRRSTPRFTVPLTGLDAKGRATTINKAPGPTKVLSGPSTIKVGNNFFTRPNVSIPKGATVTWQFNTPKNTSEISMAGIHNVTLANGPRGFSSPNYNGGSTYTRRFNTPGRYRYFCGWHPVTMTGTVTVRSES